MNKKVRQLVGIYSVIAGMTLAGLAPQAPVRAEAEVATGEPSTSRLIRQNRL